MQQECVDDPFGFGQHTFVGARVSAVVVRLAQPIECASLASSGFLLLSICVSVFLIELRKLGPERPQLVVRIFQSALLVFEPLNRSGRASPIDTREVLELEQPVGGPQLLFACFTPAIQLITLPLHGKQAAPKLVLLATQCLQLRPVVPAENIARAILDPM